MVTIIFVMVAVIFIYGLTWYFLGKTIEELKRQMQYLQGAADGVDLLKAQIRAFQDYGKPEGGRMRYLIQNTRGKFARVYLPRV